MKDYTWHNLSERAAWALRTACDDLGIKYQGYSGHITAYVPDSIGYDALYNMAVALI